MSSSDALTPRDQRRDPVEELADEFIQRRRSGEKLEISDFVSHHPQYAAGLERYLPTMLLLEGSARDHERETQLDRSPIRVGSRFGEYLLVRELGRGGMGIVYEAEHETLERSVALKVLPQHSRLDPNALARFQLEARAAAKLDHPNLVPVYEVGETDGVQYYAMRRIDGHGLDRVIETASANGSHPSSAEMHRETARIFLHVAEALAFAHAQGILHRDIKPSNLLLEECGHVWVTDFGLAKSDESGQLTRTGDVVGTLRYVAPEKFHGAEGVRSEVFSLGLTLYEALTLRPAREGRTREEIVRSILATEPVPPRRIDLRIPRDLETIVLEALHPEPELRYASMAEFAADLRRFLESRPIAARRSGPVEKSRLWVRRNRTVAGLTFAIVVLLFGVAATTTFLAWRLETERQAAIRAKQDREDQLWASRLAESRAGRWSRRPGQRTSSLDALWDAAKLKPSREIRSGAISAMTLIDVREGREVQGTTAQTRRMYPDDTLKIFAELDADRRHFRVLRAKDRAIIDEFASKVGRVAGVKIDSTSRYVIVRSGSAVQVRDLLDKRDLWRAAADRLLSGRTPNGGLLVSRGKTVLELDLVSGRELGRCEVGLRPDSAELSSQGTLAVASKTYFDVELRDWKTGRGTRLLAHRDGVRSIAFSADGEYLASGSEDFRAQVWRVDDGVLVSTLSGHRAEVTELSFHPRRSYLVTSSWDGSTCFWNYRSGELALRCDGGSGTLSPNGNHLVVRRSRSLNSLSVTYGSEFFRLYAHRKGKGPRHVSIHPSLPLLAASGLDGVAFWHTETGEALAFVTRDDVRGTYFSPDGEGAWMCGKSGVDYWPLGVDTETNRWRFGPPKRVFSGSTGRGALSRDGSMFCVEYEDCVVKIDREQAKHEPIGRCRGASSVDISPNNRWVAAGAWGYEGVRVWDLESPGDIRTLPGWSAHLGFSPDGEWLIVSTGGLYRQIRVGAWEEVRSYSREGGGGVAGPIGFSADGTLLALATSGAATRFVSPESGEELARLETRSYERLAYFAFAPGNGRFVETTESRQVRIWDLHLIRDQLRTHGLDWDGARGEGDVPSPSFGAWVVDEGDGPSVVTQLRLSVEKERLDGVIRQLAK
ncbi:MAG: WD40 repeat domain-containing serine/threonine-protein kinase [Planctomycetota bacterium]